MSNFISGLELSRLLYLEAVKPILDENFPHLRYSAALIGEGSEVLGFDTEMSADHAWGARLMIFLEEDDFAAHRETIHDLLKRRLPYQICGCPTNFSAPNLEDNGNRQLEKIESGLINHGVEILTLRDYFLYYLNFDLRQPLDLLDWLTFPEQKLRAVTAGAIYHDDIGLTETLSEFEYYPRDVWLYLLASGWNRIGQEEHLMGRAGSAGDEIGAGIIAARLVRDLMRLCFLMEKRYAAYPKWFGSAFLQLKCAEYLAPVLRKVVSAEDWREREKYLVAAYEYVAEMHNRLEITAPLPAKAGNFFNRPFQVIHLHGKFSDEICKLITEPSIKRLTEERLIGSVDQISDNTDILCGSQWRLKLRKLYE